MRIGAEKPAQLRVVHPAVHVDQAGAVQVFMAGVLAHGGMGGVVNEFLRDDTVGFPVSGFAFAKRFKRGAFHDGSTLIGDGVGGAHVVGMDVVCFRRAVAVIGAHGDGAPAGVDVVLVLGVAVLVGDFFKQLAHVVYCGDLAVFVFHLLVAVTIWPIAERKLRCPFTDEFGFVEAAPAQGLAVVAGEGVAVTVIFHTRVGATVNAPGNTGDIVDIDIGIALAIGITRRLRRAYHEF